MKTKKAYIAPQMTVESYEGEIGYAVSLTLINNQVDLETWDNSYQERWSYDNTRDFGGTQESPNWSWD